MHLRWEPGFEDFRRDPGHDGPRRYGPCDDGPGADNGALTDIGQDDRGVANPRALTYGDQTSPSLAVRGWGGKGLRCRECRDRLEYERLTRPGHPAPGAPGPGGSPRLHKRSPRGERPSWRRRFHSKRWRTRDSPREPPPEMPASDTARGCLVRQPVTAWNPRAPGPDPIAVLLHETTRPVAARLLKQLPGSGV